MLIALLIAIIVLLGVLVLAVTGLVFKVSNLHRGLDLLSDVVFIQSTDAALDKVFGPNGRDVIAHLLTSALTLPAPDPSTRQPGLWPAPAAIAA